MPMPFRKITDEAFVELAKADPEGAIAYIRAALHAGELEAGTIRQDLRGCVHRRARHAKGEPPGERSQRLQRQGRCVTSRCAC